VWVKRTVYMWVGRVGGLGEYGVGSGGWAVAGGGRVEQRPQR